MDVRTTIPISEARRRIFEIREELRVPGRYYTLTEKGRPAIVMLSAEEFESLIETLEVMRDFPDLKKDIMESEKEYKSGKYKSYITLDELLEEEKITAIKKVNKNVIRSTPKASRGKRTKKST